MVHRSEFNAWWHEKKDKRKGYRVCKLANKLEFRAVYDSKKLWIKKSGRFSKERTKQVKKGRLAVTMREINHTELESEEWGPKPRSPRRESSRKGYPMARDVVGGGEQSTV